MAIARCLCSVLIGREEELGELEDAILEALRGEGGVVLLGGEAGMGKSRLASDLARRAERLGARVLEGGCSEAELALPYLPFLEAIGNHLSRSDLKALAGRLGTAAAELTQLFPQIGLAPPAQADPTQAKLRLFEALVAVLRDAADPGGLLLVIEDIHWADPSTRELLDYLTRRLRAERVLVLTTYRSDELHRRHPLTPTVLGWRRAGSVREVQVPALDPAGVAGMVRAIFDEQDVSGEFRDFLHRRTEGNPFVIEEMLKAAIDRGDIFRDDTGWDRKAVAELSLPETVRDTILLRIERLGAEERDVLSAAAVIGRSFDLGDLIAVSGRDEEQVVAALQACVLHQLLEETGGGYQFRHALTREAVYEDMLQPVRRRLHAHVADVMLARPGAPSVDIANHLLAAGRNEEGARMCAVAGDEAMRASAYGAAAALYERAAEQATGAQRGRLLSKAGAARTANQDPLITRQLLEEAIQLLEAEGARADAARARLDLGRSHWDLQRPDLARAEYELALQELDPLGPSAALALAYVRLAGLEVFEYDDAKGLEYGRRALEVAEAAGAPLEHAWAWNFIAIAECGLGRVEQGLQSMERSYEECVAGGFGWQAQNAVYNAIWITVHLGDGKAATRWLGRNSEDDRVMGAAYLRGLVHLYRGDVPDGVRLARRAVEAAEASGHEKMSWRTRVLLAHALAEAGQAVEATGVLPAVGTRVEGQDEIYDGAARVRVALARDDPEAVLEAAFSVQPGSSGLAAPVDAVAEGGAGNPDRLEAFMREVELSEEVQKSPRWITALGRLALAQGHLEEARERLQAGVQGFLECGFRLDAWHASRALAAAEAALGATEPATARLSAVVQEATAAGAALAARLAAETAASLGLAIATADGAPQEPDAPVAVGERLVTVLFVDVRGYTALTGRTAPADLADKIGTLQRWAAEEVRRHRGVVDKFAGDAVMATFNVSGASVDHTEHALAAALAIRDKAAALGLPVGAGIAVGPAVVGRFADGGNLSVLGEVTNLAARLQASSGAGEVTLSQEAHRRLRDGGASRAEPLQLELKGFAEPVTAYRLTS